MKNLKTTYENCNYCLVKRFGYKSPDSLLEIFTVGRKPGERIFLLYLNYGN